MIKEIKLTTQEREEILISLSVRCGIIETGTPNRAIDMIRAGEATKVKDLSQEQQEFIVFLNNLMKKFY